MIRTKAYLRDSLNKHLVIGSPEYNKIRYPAKGGDKPLWKTDLENQLTRKRLGTWNYEKRNAGDFVVITSPDKIQFKRDLYTCISNSLHFKTRTFEYKPVDGSIYVKGQYVGRYDSSKGELHSFTLRNLNDKLSRYRLKDFGINLVCVDGKTYLRIRASELYMAYLRFIYGSELEMKIALSHLFKSIKTKQVIIREEVTIEIYCELREDLEYPACIVSENLEFDTDALEFYRTNDLLHVLHDDGFKENSSSLIVPELALRRCTESLKIAREGDGMPGTYNLAKCLSSMFSNINVVQELSKNKPYISKPDFRTLFGLSEDGLRFYVHKSDQLIEIQLYYGEDKSRTMSLEELGLQDHFKNGYLKIVPNCAIELTDFVHADLKVYMNSENGPVPLTNILNKPCNNSLLRPLLGKELLVE